MSQETLAEAAGLHRTYISLLERGLQEPQLGTIAALAGGLGTSMSSLLGELERS